MNWMFLSPQHSQHLAAMFRASSHTRSPNSITSTRFLAYSTAWLPPHHASSKSLKTAPSPPREIIQRSIKCAPASLVKAPRLSGSVAIQRRCRHWGCLTAFGWHSRRMGVRGIGLEGVWMRSRKRSVFVYSYSGLLDACKCRALTTTCSHHMVGFIPMHWSMLVSEI